MGIITIDKMTSKSYKIKLSAQGSNEPSVSVATMANKPPDKRSKEGERERERDWPDKEELIRSKASTHIISESAARIPLE